MDIFIDVEKRPIHFCPLLCSISISPCSRQCQRWQPGARDNRSCRGPEQGSERRDSGKSENSFPWDSRCSVCLFVSSAAGCVRGTPGPRSRFQPSRAGHGSGGAALGAGWRKCWRPSGTTGRNPRSGPACWAGAGTGSMGSTGNAGWGRAGPGGEAGGTHGGRGAPKMGVASRRAPAPSGDGSPSCFSGCGRGKLNAFLCLPASAVL